MQDIGEDPAGRIGEAERGIGIGALDAIVADRHAGTRRTRSIRRPDTAQVKSPTSTTSAGISIHSQDGDRIENPAKTGCRTHGDFSAANVTAAGTMAYSPAAMTRISSGVTAASASGHAASTATAARPAQP